MEDTNIPNVIRFSCSVCSYGLYPGKTRYYCAACNIDVCRRCQMRGDFRQSTHVIDHKTTAITIPYPPPAPVQILDFGGVPNQLSLADSNTRTSRLRENPPTVLYLITSPEAATKSTLPAIEGQAGTGVYFTSRLPEAEEIKDDQVLLKALVKLGTVKNFDPTDEQFNMKSLFEVECDSVRFVSDTGVEYVVFSPDQIVTLEQVAIPPEPGLTSLDPVKFATARLHLLQPEAGNIELQTRDDYMLVMARALIFKAKCSLYGGFVRDWVVRGEEATDIDAHLPDDNMADPEPVIKILEQVGAEYNITLKGKQPKGAAVCAHFQGPWEGPDITVDLVSPHLDKPHPGVDSDASNLTITPDGHLKRCLEVGLPLSKALDHIAKKRFVFYYDTTKLDPQMCIQRLYKYLDVKRWICVSPVPADVLRELDRRAANRVLPKSKYDIKW